MAHFRPNPAFHEQMEATPGYQKAMSAVASDAARHVKAAAQPSRNTGAFIRSISSPGARVATSDPFYHLIEWGGATNPPYAPFRKGFRAAGLDLQFTERQRAA